MIRFMRSIAIAAFLFATTLVAQTPAKPDGAIGIAPDAVVWNDGPATLPPGSKMAVLEGSPRSEGMFTMRVRIPAGSAIAPHWHPRPERVTILAGAVDLGFGSVANAKSVTRYRAGSFYVNPPRVMHYLFFPEATEMQMTGEGPWELFTTDVNPQPIGAPTATVTVRSITPAAGSEVTSSTTIKATVDYDIKNFKPSTYYIDFVFETTTPNRTFSGGPRPGYVDAATGTITLTQDLGAVFAHPDLKKPIRMRVYVHQQLTERSNHVAGLSDWIEFR